VIQQIVKPTAAISVLLLADLQNLESGEPLPAVHTGTTVAAETYMLACCVFQIASRKNSI